MIRVDSSNIASMGWQINEVLEDAPGVLFVKFTSGDVYRYAKVPYTTYQELLDASSTGSLFNAKVKGDPTAHPYKKVTE